jgi:pimeloyl-ACP methyl ester carboxylesterase
VGLNRILYNDVCRLARSIALSIALAALIGIGLQGCAFTQKGQADSIADIGDLRREDIASEPFTLITYSRITDINLPITVYIEGDIQGFWPTVEPGADPTSDDFLGLRLAALDPSPNVAYIARPCQFSSSDDIACDPSNWNGRYAELIITSMNRAVDHFAVPFIQPRLNLVGYSGGAAIAAIIATRRKDVVTLRSIAGNLDPAATSRYHAADLDEDFTDPMLIAPRLKLIPQIHYAGEADTVVPPFLTANFVKAVGPSFCDRMVTFPGVTHKTGWEKVWKAHATEIPTCGYRPD